MSEVSEEKWWGGRREEGRKEGAADAALKTKTPHVNVGNCGAPWDIIGKVGTSILQGEAREFGNNYQLCIIMKASFC